MFEQIRDDFVEQAHSFQMGHLYSGGGWVEWRDRSNVVNVHAI